MPEDILQKYYQYLKDNNADVPKYYSIFQNKMSDKLFAEKYFGYLKDNQFDVPDKFETFSGKLNLFNEDTKQKLAPKNTKELSSAQDIGMAFTVPQAKKENEEEMNKSAAVNNSFKTWLGLTKTDENSLQAKNKKKELQDGLGNGSYNIVFDAKGVPTLGMSIGGLHSFTKSLKETGDAYDEGKNLRTMDDHSAVKYLNKKMSKPEEFLPETPNGILGYLGEAGGGISRIIAKEGAGTLAVRSIAGLLSPETGGLSLAALSVLGGIPGAADEIANLNYGAELQKYYVKGKEMKLSDDEAIAKAREQANFALGSGVLEAAAYTAGGEIFGAMFKGGGTGSGVKKAISKAIRYAAPATALATSVPVASSVARDLHAKQVGYNLTNEEIFKNAWDKSSDALKITAGTFLLHAGIHGAIKMDNYVNSQLKNFVASANNNIAERFLDVLSEAQIIYPTDASKTKEDINQTRQAQQKIKLLGVESNEDVHGSLVNKYQEKVKIQAEIDQLEKDGIKAGIEERKNRITQLDKDIQDIYKTGDTDKHEVNYEVPLADDHFLPATKEQAKPTEENKDISFSKDYQGIKIIQDIISSDSDKEVLNEIEFLKTTEGQEFLNDLKEDYKGKGKEWPSMSDKEAYEIDRKAKMVEDLMGAMAKQGVYLDMGDAFDMVDKIDEGYKKKAKEQERQGLEILSQEIFGEEEPTKETNPEEQYGFSKKTDKQLESRYIKLESAEKGTPEKQEFYAIQKELSRRELRSVIDAPLKDIPKIMDKLLKTEGKREVDATKKVAIRYSEENVSKLKDKDIIEDFTNAINRLDGGAEFYSEDLKVRETIKEAAKRNIDLTDEYLKDPKRKGNIDFAKDKLNFTLEELGFEMPKKEFAPKTKATKKVTTKVKLTEEQKQSNIDKATAKQRAEAINQTEQEYGSTTDKGVPTGEIAGVSGNVSSEPASKPSGEITTQTWETAGYRSESDFNADYESNRDRAAKETKEIFLAKKHCGEL